MYYLCSMGMSRALIGQKKVSDPLESELGIAASYSVGVGNQTWIFGKSNQCF